MVGFILVLIFMMIYYRVFGVFANVALALNLVLIVAVIANNHMTFGEFTGF